jgi:hypothetical protein
LPTAFVSVGVGPFVATTGCFATEIRPQSPPRSSSGL